MRYVIAASLAFLAAVSIEVATASPASAQYTPGQSWNVGPDVRINIASNEPGGSHLYIVNLYNAGRQTCYFLFELSDGTRLELLAYPDNSDWNHVRSGVRIGRAAGRCFDDREDARAYRQNPNRFADMRPHMRYLPD